MQPDRILRSPDQALQDDASEQLGFKVLDHKLQIYGCVAIVRL
jgi:hypothetical protein